MEEKSGSRLSEDFQRKMTGMGEIIAPETAVSVSGEGAPGGGEGSVFHAVLEKWEARQKSSPQKAALTLDLEEISSEIRGFRQSYDRWISQFHMALSYYGRIRLDRINRNQSRNGFDRFEKWVQLFKGMNLPFSESVRRIETLYGEVLSLAGILYRKHWPGEPSSIAEYRRLVGHESDPQDGGLHGSLIEQIDGLLDKIHTVQCAIDPLTGIPNQFPFTGGAPHFSNRRNRSCLLAFDIDHFKGINDSFGHLVGDAVLCEVAGIFQSKLREGDQGLAYRIGGDEFIILVHMGIRKAVCLAERLRAEVENRFINGFSCGGKALGDLRVTVSVGVALLPPALLIDQAWIIARQSADEALYRAKRSGRNKVAFFSPSRLA